MTTTLLLTITNNQASRAIIWSIRCKRTRWTLNGASACALGSRPWARWMLRPHRVTNGSVLRKVDNSQKGSPGRTPQSSNRPCLRSAQGPAAAATTAHSTKAALNKSSYKWTETAKSKRSRNYRRFKRKWSSSKTANPRKKTGKKTARPPACNSKAQQISWDTWSNKSSALFSDTKLGQSQ